MFKKIALVATLSVLSVPLAWSQQEGVTPPPEAPANSAASVPASVPAQKQEPVPVQKQEPVPAQREERVSKWYDDIYLETGLGYVTNGGLASVSQIGKDWTIADKQQLGIFFSNISLATNGAELTSAAGPTKTAFSMDAITGAAYSYAPQDNIKVIAQAVLGYGRVYKGIFRDSSSTYRYTSRGWGTSVQYSLGLSVLYLFSDSLRHGAVLSYSYLGGNKYDIDVAGVAVEHKLANTHVISLRYRYTFVGF